MADSNQKKKNLTRVLNIYTAIGITLWIIAIVLLITPSLPYLWYRINKNAIDQEVDTIAAPTEEDADPKISFADLIESYNNEKSNKPTEPELCWNGSFQAALHQVWLEMGQKMKAKDHPFLSP